MADIWHQIEDPFEVDPNGEFYVTHALDLLKATAAGYDRLTVPILQEKMKRGQRPGTQLWCLRLWSFPDKLNPKVSAFFFLRRRRRPGNADGKGLWAYCLSVGAKDESIDGLNASDLKKELNNVCLKMEDAAPEPAGKHLEIMHAPLEPIFYFNNLRTAFRQLRTASAPPKLVGRGGPLSTIVVNEPWSYLQGEEVQIWLKIIPKR